MPEENRGPEDVQPLARSVNEQQLARPVVEEQEETGQTEDARPEASPEEPQTGQQEAAPPDAEPEEEQGLISKAVDKAREQGLVSESTVDKAREKGLIEKADEAIDKARRKLTGGAMLANVISVILLIIETVMLRR